MSDTVITVQESDDVTQVASLMVERGMSGCPVLNKEGKLVGLITKKQITQLVEKFTDIKVDSMMTTEGLITVNPAERLVKARLEMLNGGYSGLPVTDGRRVLGLLTERTVAEIMARFSSEVPDKHRANQIRQLRVVDAMIQQPPLVQQGASVGEAAKMMLESGLNALPVVGEGNILLGIISATDFTRFASNKFKIHENGD